MKVTITLPSGASTDNSPSQRLLTRRFVVLLATLLSFGFAHSSYFLLPKFMVTDLSASAAQIGLVIAGYGVVVVFCMPAMGAAVDRYGRRDFLTAGSLLMTASSLGYLAVGGVGPLLFGLRGLQAVAFSMAYAAGAALAVDEAPPQRLGQAIGLFGLAFLAMEGGAALVIEYLAEVAGWPYAFAVAAGAAAAATALSRLVRSQYRMADQYSDSVGLLEMLGRGGMLRPMLVVVLAGTAMCAMFVFHQPFALELGAMRVGDFFIAYTIAAIAVRLGFGQVIDRTGRRLFSACALLAYAVSVTAMAWLEPGALALYGAGLGIAHGLFYPAFTALAVEGLGKQERGKGMTLLQGSFNVGFAGSAFALGLLAEALGHPAVFIAGGGCCLLALSLVLTSPGRSSRLRRTRARLLAHEFSHALTQAGQSRYKSDRHT
ncbi:MAG: MFS transporter [Proteobacteria bacterium]|nr:MFS transporter [Pseudomonadota bacterium]